MSVSSKVLLASHIVLVQKLPIRRPLHQIHLKVIQLIKVLVVIGFIGPEPCLPMRR